MKHILIKFSFLVILSILLVACSDKEDSEAVESDTAITEEDNSSEETGDELTEEESETEDKTETEDAANTDSPSANSGNLPENQLGLGIGDTATVKNNYSEHEITLNSVEIKEQAGETTSELGNFVIVDLTVLNTGEEAVTADSVFSSTNLASVDNSSGFPWYYLEGVAEEWPSEIEPGESQTGVLLFDVEVSDQYILNIAEFLDGLSNQVSFEFTSEEAE
jgi:hypothetical protein